MGQSKDPIDMLNRIDKQRELKKKAGQDKEKLEAMGQESDSKAAKWVKEAGKEERKKEEVRIAGVMQTLNDNKKSVVTYKEVLLQEMKKEMLYWDDDLPQGFHWLPQSTDKGIVLWIRNPKREYYAKGVKLSGTPEIDLNAIARMIVTAVKEMDKQATPITQNGIILPYK